LVEAVCQYYPQLRRDMLLAGAALHDVGKIRELHSAWRPDYTTEGRLLGHVVLGVQMLGKKLRDVEAFSQQDAIELEHLILSHHGKLEYGSPRRPKTLEALVLNIIDDLDAKFDAFQKHLLTDEGGEKMWTTYHPLFDRYLYRGHLAVEAPEDKA
jgi:3'-5' exoribonuclease